MSCTSISAIEPQKLNYQVAIASTINCYCLISRIFKEEWPDDGSSPKSAPNSDKLWKHLFLNNHSFSEPQKRQFCRLTKMKMSLVEDDFVRKISIHLLLFHNSFNELSSPMCYSIHNPILYNL